MYALAVLSGKAFEFLVDIVHPPRHGGPPPHLYPFQQDGRGYNLPPQWWKTKYVCFGGTFRQGIRIFVYIVHPPRHGGNPPHLYPSSSVRGWVQFTAKIAENMSGMLSGYFLGEEFDFVVHVRRRP